MRTRWLVLVLAATGLVVAGGLLSLRPSAPPGDRPADPPAEPEPVVPPPVVPGPAIPAPDPAPEPTPPPDPETIPAPPAEKEDPLSPEVLRRSLASEDPHTRYRAAWKLASLGYGSVEVVRALMTTLEDPDERKRMSSLRALLVLGPAAREAAPIVERVMNGADFPVRILGARVLWRITGEAERSVEELSDIVRVCPRHTVQLAAWGLALMEEEAVAGVPVLIERLTAEGTPNVDRAQILYSLGRIGRGAADALPLAREALEDPSLKVRTCAAYGVWGMSGEVATVLPLLREGLEHGDADVSCWAAGWIGDLGSEAVSAVPALRAAMEKRKPHIAVRAASSIYRLTGESKRPLAVLVKGLSDSRARSDAVRYLGEMGRHARPALPALRKAQKSGYLHFRREVTKAIEAISAE